MRLWSIHPSYLDRQGLGGCWREALLAQKVLAGNTKGYKNHSQLIRFKSTSNPLTYISSFLTSIHEEAARRGYNYDSSKILPFSEIEEKIPVTHGQLLYEFNHLVQNKLKKRSFDRYCKYKKIANPEVNHFFKVVPGPIEIWEKQL